MKWTQLETDTLVRLKAAGFSYQQIGDQLGRGKASVRQRLAVLNGATRRHCDCGAEVGPKNVSGFCRRCAAMRSYSDPVKRAARLAGFMAHMDQPGVKQELARRLAKHRETMSDEERERRRLHGVRQYTTILSRPDIKEKCRAAKNSPAARAIISEKAIARTLTWCPRSYRKDYHALIRKRCKPDEAKGIILAQVASDERRRIAAMTPLERQLEAVRNGASLSERVAMPSRMHAFSLHGSSMRDL